MAKYIATIQEGHAAENMKQELEKSLKEIAYDSLGKFVTNSEVIWKVIPKGYGFTAGRLSNSSILLCVIPDEVEFKVRANFMQRLNELWVRQTGANSHELLIYTLGEAL